MIKRKTAECIECGHTRLIYSKKMCGYCYQRSKPRKPIVKKPYTIPKRSAQGKINDRKYYTIAKQYKLDNPYCKARLNGCTRHTTDVHHKKGRGIHLLRVEYFLPVCRNCHDYIELNPDEALLKGFSLLRLKTQ